jgi:hypothetical protein
MLNYCPYCNFETSGPINKNINFSNKKEEPINNIALQMPKSFKKHSLKNHWQELTPYYETALPLTQRPLYDKKLKDLELLYSDFMFPFEKDINGFFKDRFNSLKKGGFLILSVPVTGVFFKAVPLEGQINFFRSKNIMFLLERHGFKLIKRSMPWGSILYLIAQKM